MTCKPPRGKLTSPRYCRAIPEVFNRLVIIVIVFHIGHKKTCFAQVTLVKVLPKILIQLAELFIFQSVNQLVINIKDGFKTKRPL